MKRMLLKSLKTIVPEEVETPVPGVGEVLLRVEKVAVCGSDISAFYGKHPYIPFPMVLGHEFAGRVVSAGRFRTDGIFTHRFSLDQVPEMYAFVDGKSEEFIKLLIEVPLG